MTPVPQEHAEPAGTESSFNGDGIVISGMAGLLPGCASVEEFARKLYNKVDLVKETPHRWSYSHPELPSHAGLISGLERFDSQFFMVNHRLANNVDVMSRKLLELSYAALFDAGVSPVELNGKKVGVFVASSICEAEQIVCSGTGKDEIVGCSRTMFANRISYYLSTIGPSLMVDCNGCGGMVALEKAQQAIQDGVCEAAIVGACKLLLHPHSLIHHGRALSLNKDGETRSYDKNGNGHALSEAIHVIYLQKQKDARRIYATLCHVQTGYNKLQRQKDYEFGFIREPMGLEAFLRNFYEKAGVPTSSVDYVEGVGIGDIESDTAELEVIERVFVKDRKGPVLVGSVTSNIGYTEAASGLSSMVKVLLAHHKGSIAPNLHCENPLGIKAIKNGSIRIVTEEEKLSRTYTAVNSCSFMGVVAHALLKSHYVPKDATKYHTSMPYLVAVSGRHNQAVNKIFNWLKSHPVDAEEISLLNSIHRHVIKLHLARGFAIYSKVPNDVPKILKLKIDPYNNINCPLWFVYSGMGSQWAGMGKELMKIPVFTEAVRRCDEVLSKKGIDIVNIIISSEKTIFDNILHSFVGIAAIQIGITDVLKTVGITPDKIIGHSVGELGCAYADGCVTAEEMILLAYYRGLVSLETNFIKGSMAAVGLGYKQISKLLPPEIDVACHNSAESSTISGPADVLKKFVAELTSQGIFAKEVACSNIAYHSRYITKAGENLLKYCKSVITTPKLRSKRWVSTSIPQEQWETKAKYSSAEYHVNNLLSPVLFEESSQLIPPNAVLIEIAPHSLLQAILLRALPKECDYIPLTRRGHPDNTAFLLEGLGRLYQKGYPMDANALYPKIVYPVSTGTSNVSHLVDWDHSEEWNTFSFKQSNRHLTTTYNLIVTLHDEEHEYFRGYTTRGNIVLPYGAILNYVWKILAMTLKVRKDILPLKFENVHFYSQPIITENTSLHLSCQLHRVSGHFEVINEKDVIANGYVSCEPTEDSNVEEDQTQHLMDVDSRTLYRLLRERGYQLKDGFQVIQRSDKYLNHAEIKCNGNWVTFIDGILQMMILKTGHDGISKLEHIHKLTINNQNPIEGENFPTFQFRFHQLENLVKCGPVEIENVTFKNIPCTVTQKPIIRHQKFISFDQRGTDYDEPTNLYIFFQIVSENVNKKSLNVIEIERPLDDNSTQKLEQLMNSPQDKEFKKTIVKQDQLTKMNMYDFTNVDIVILNKIDSEIKVFEILYKLLPQNIFIINIAYHTKTLYPLSSYKVIASANNEYERLELAIWKQTLPMSTTAITLKSSSDFAFLRDTHANLPANHKLLVFTSYPSPTGFKDLIKELKSKDGCNQVLAVIIDKESSKGNFEDTANFDLAFNILKQGKWGGEYYVPEFKVKHNSITNVILQTKIPGDINSVSWVEVPESSEAGYPVQVYFAGLNLYDARVASAEIIPLCSKGFGMDFSGVTKSGVCVMGIVKSGAASVLVNAEPELLWPVPKHWSLEDAATVPLPYCLAFYCLGIIVDLYPRQSIFVHGGAGAVGQAVISIALAHGCNIFTTVSDLQKKRFLKCLFPDLPADHIGNSRDDSFSDMVLLKTKGEGCDIIISSVKGKLKDPTLKCCANYGTTIDLVQVHTRENFKYGMFFMTKARSYVPIDFAAIFNQEKTRSIVQKLHGMVSEGIRQGYVRPLSRVTYDAHDASRALRLLAASRHRGRVLVNMKTLTPEMVVPKVLCSPEKYKLIFCEEQEISLQFVDTLIKHGAKKLIVHSPKPSAILDFKKQAWNNLGAEVNLFFANLMDKNNIKGLFKEALNFGGVDGIYFFTMDNNSIHKDVLTDVDQISREFALSLRHFAIITQDQQLGYETYSSRIQNGLPSIRIQLHNPEKYENDGNTKTSETLNNRSSLEAIMSILSNESSSVFVYADTSSESNILAELSKITDSKMINMDDETTLEDVGIDENYAQLVYNIVENKFGIHFNKCDVPKITIGRLKSLEPKPKAELTQGLERYFSYIDSDEISANWDFFTMKTFLQSSDTCFDEFNMGASYLCIVPGLEGHHLRFVHLCERLKIRAMVLQPGFDLHHESVDDVAERFVGVMKKKLKLKNDFHLLGYEFGAEIALKMARIFENSGMTGTVYCLGGEPEEIKTTIVSQLNYNTEDELQIAIVQHIYKKLNRKSFEEINKKLKEANNWQDRIGICTTLLRGNAMQSIQYISDLLETLYSRIKILEHNEVNSKLFNSKIVFIRGNVLKKLPANMLQNMYGNKIIVHDLDADVMELPKDLRVPNFINKYLSKEVIDEYDKSNRCETVLLETLVQ